MAATASLLASVSACLCLKPTHRVAFPATNRRLNQNAQSLTELPQRVVRAPALLHGATSRMRLEGRGWEVGVVRGGATGGASAGAPASLFPRRGSSSQPPWLVSGASSSSRFRVGGSPLEPESHCRPILRPDGVKKTPSFPLDSLAAWASRRFQGPAGASDGRTFGPQAGSRRDRGENPTTLLIPRNARGFWGA